MTVNDYGDERYYACGGYGSVKIFDRKHQKYVSGVTFKDEQEAQDMIDALTAPDFLPNVEDYK